MDQLDITACDREPIHIPGKIQPHGVLLALDRSTLNVLYASENTKSMLGFSPQELFSGGISLFTRPESLSDLSRILNPVRLLTHSGVELDAIIHLDGNVLIVEFEKSTASTSLLREHGFSSVYAQIDAALRAIEQSADFSLLFSESAEQIRTLTGFDRVMIYRFDSEWNGRVIAESKKDSMSSFMDLHFPASDIPKQARELYLINWLRIIPEVHYEPSGLLSVVGDERPLDMTYSVLRSVSPIHIQYLKNMGIGASMSISIIRDGRLWGLIACHHEAALYVNYETRQGCEFIGKFLSLQIAAKEKLQDVEARAQKRSMIADLEVQMRRQIGGNFFSGLFQDTSLLELIPAEGAATLFRGQISTLGKCPSEDQIRALADFLFKNKSGEAVFITESLAKLFPESIAFKDQASGVVALSVPEPEPTYVFWFRPEVIQTVKWSGSPEKGPSLTPRSSFEEWKETVKYRSEPWSGLDLETAEEFRQRIIAIDLTKQIDLELRAREQAEQSNRELDEFARVVSHDLRDPLRGIKYFSKFIKQDESLKISPSSLENLEQIDGLCTRMSSLIESLYQYSKLGQTELAYGWWNLNEIVQSSVQRCQHLIQERKIDVRVQKDFPETYCDRVRVEELFSNLISNAIKYNISPEPFIEVGFDPSQDPVEFFVADNGIGIESQNFEKIFQIFERLHPVDRFGGGTGTGLSIVERIVKKHQGRIRVTSAIGNGSRFSFTLAARS